MDWLWNSWNRGRLKERLLCDSIGTITTVHAHGDTVCNAHACSSVRCVSPCLKRVILRISFWERRLSITPTMAIPQSIKDFIDLDLA